MTKHIHPNPAPEEKVQSLSIDFDTPWLTEGKHTNQHEDDASEFSHLRKTTL
jgi:hypothetical protein